MGISIQDQERFTSKINYVPGQGPQGECHEWLAGLDTHGYGQFWLAGRNRLATHVAWEIAKRHRTVGLGLLHVCDNRRCVRVDHLYEGSPKQNSADATERDRHRRGEQHGNAKLKATDIKAIRKASATQMELAAQYSVSQTAISSILRRRTWAHVA